ncbi:MAG: hypothetical protein CGU28_03200 [Candidatus Dactylopiibacterium carminicum]|uniref:Host-nuclease inhibitor protein Gam n=1 Tax=Candidatus Dactylopiibacterium carminicum TaxID=857335 RepID=A0A272EYG9_9RHOO|nr:host-nuclease inhibitor Gam family protein [Candidatus Dactylopiibacterium carminicum]KAF7600610.1 hypothetical protein BGI27_01625 [Candidatus Dactylopiibacterium carminicum]PAS95153.1 MAG: hypothetical protein CGU29_01540 [Candidatus Dactylopiibacterium carminicum]PAS97958.1 MAG: hypothetical protein CGU28_03200 [Candidatus Dactylopiibacterium carminicum]PAT00610.1 MAG: hypothetical protein BSR46_01635 [Candidatus Dactylopiibacterium carminicum]
MTAMNDIERQAERYSEARETLAGLLTELQATTEAIKSDRLPAIRRAIRRASEQHDKLRALIEEAPDLFAKPKSRVLHGIKVGFQKSKGKIEFDDPDRVVLLIERHFPEQADVLIATSKKPAKDALANLTGAELKRLGINVIEGGDVLLIRPVDSAVDKMVDALLKAATDDKQDEEGE